MTKRNLFWVGCWALACLLSLLTLTGQVGGTIVVNTTVTATAGTGSSAVICVITPTPAGGPYTGAAYSCTINSAVVMSGSTTPPVGNTGGIVGSVGEPSASNNVTWTITSAAAGSVAWSAAANGVSKSGAF